MGKRPEVLYGISVNEIARICGVDLATARRWKRGATCPPKTAQMVLARDLGIFDPYWAGWTIKGRELVSPEGWQITRGDVLASPLHRQRTAAIEAENWGLKAKLEELETANVVPDIEDQPAPEEWPAFMVK